MNVLCPDCQSSVPITGNDRWLRCSRCGLEADLSRLETSPGLASLSLVQDLVGETLAGYRLEALVGVGGMGVVYRGRREPAKADHEAAGGAADDGADDGAVPALDEDAVVAVKVLHTDYHHQQQAFVERFRREAQALAKLHHPGIVRLLDSGREGRHHFLVTEFVQGPNLAERLRDGPLPLDEAVDIVARVCDALEYAHDRGVVHRDIKPANILIAADGPKVVDFGLAQITGWDSTVTSLTRTNLAMGTFNYLSPEQRVNAKEVDARADLFSLGVVLYEALLGELPLGAFVAPSRRDHRLPRRLDPLVRRVLAKDPADRHESAAALGAELRRLVAPRRVPRAAVLAALLTLVLGSAGALTYALWPGDRALSPRPALAQGPPGQANDPATTKPPGSLPPADTPQKGNAPNVDRGNSKAEPQPAPVSRPGPEPPPTTKGSVSSRVKGAPVRRVKGVKGEPVVKASWGTKRARGRSKKRVEAPPRPAPRRAAPVKRGLKQVVAIARKYGFSFKGDPGPPPLRLAKSFPQVYAFWRQRHQAYLESFRSRPSSPRRVP